MLERIIYLAIIFLLVKYWFQNHWSDSKHNAKVYGQQVNTNVYVRCFAIMVVQENSWIVSVTPFCTDLYFLCKYFLYLCHYFYSHHHSFSNRDTCQRIIGHTNMYLVKTNWEKNWHVLCLAERKRPFWGDLVLAWISWVSK